MGSKTQWLVVAEYLQLTENIKNYREIMFDIPNDPKYTINEASHLMDQYNKAVFEAKEGLTKIANRHFYSDQWKREKYTETIMVPSTSGEFLPMKTTKKKANLHAEALEKMRADFKKLEDFNNRPYVRPDKMQGLYPIIKFRENYMKCGDCNKFYLCTTCGAQCGSEGHYIETDPVEPPRYFIGVDTYDENNLAYCLSKRDSGGNVEIIMSKTVRDKNTFNEEVENLSKYFNATKIEERK